MGLSQFAYNPRAFAEAPLTWDFSLTAELVATPQQGLEFYNQSPRLQTCPCPAEQEEDPCGAWLIGAAAQSIFTGVL